MSEELKPCPFCGGGAHFIKVKHVVGVWYTVCCDNAECFGHEQSRLYTLRRLAAEAWNRRAERTCRWEHIEGTLFVTECGETYGRVVPDNYCPHCGAKVVDE